MAWACYSFQRDSQQRYYILDYDVPLDTPPVVHSIYPDYTSAYEQYLILHNYPAAMAARCARSKAHWHYAAPLDGRYFTHDGQRLVA